MKILFADDHVLVRDAIVALLDQEDDFDITTVDDLQTALAESVAGFDLVLLDYNMPGMTGLELLGQIREEIPKAALLTANIQPHIKAEAESMGVVFLNKPISEEVVVPFISEAS